MLGFGEQGDVDCGVPLALQLLQDRERGRAWRLAVLSGQHPQHRHRQLFDVGERVVVPGRVVIDNGADKLQQPPRHRQEVAGEVPLDCGIPRLSLVFLLQGVEPFESGVEARDHHGGCCVRDLPRLCQHRRIAEAAAAQVVEDFFAIFIERLLRETVSCNDKVRLGGRWRPRGGERYDPRPLAAALKSDGHAGLVESLPRGCKRRHRVAGESVEVLRVAPLRVAGAAFVVREDSDALRRQQILKRIGRESRPLFGAVQQDHERLRFCAVWQHKLALQCRAARMEGDAALGQRGARPRQRCTAKRHRQAAVATRTIIDDRVAGAALLAQRTAPALLLRCQGPRSAIKRGDAKCVVLADIRGRGHPVLRLPKAGDTGAPLRVDLCAARERDQHRRERERASDARRIDHSHVVPPAICGGKPRGTAGATFTSFGRNLGRGR